MLWRAMGKRSSASRRSEVQRVMSRATKTPKAVAIAQVEDEEDEDDEDEDDEDEDDEDEDDEDEDEDDDDDNEEEDGTKTAGGLLDMEAEESSTDEEDDEEEDDEPIPPRQLFTSTPLFSSTQLQPLAPTDADETSSSDSSDDSSRDSSSEEDDNASQKADAVVVDINGGGGNAMDVDGLESAPESTAMKAEAIGDSLSYTSSDDGDDDSNDDNDSDSDNNSDDDSDDDSDMSSSSSRSNDDDDDEAILDAADMEVAGSQVPGTATVADEAPTRAGLEGMESSDDGLDEIPDVLPPDMVASSAEGAAEDAHDDADAKASPKEDMPSEREDALEPESESNGMPLSLRSPVAQPKPAVTVSVLAQTPPAQRDGKMPRASQRQVAKPSLVGQLAAAVVEKVQTAIADEVAEASPVTLAAKTSKATAMATVATATPHTEPLTKPACDLVQSETSQTTTSFGSSPWTGGKRRGPMGLFTPQELDVLREMALAYAEKEGYSEEALRHMVHENAQKHTAFWDEMTSFFPGRRRLQVVLRCRRLLPNYTHAYHWTAEQDAELAALVAALGRKWQAIGARLSRSSEDCRKRWEERVVCGDRMLQSYWRFAEEQALGRVVGEFLRTIQAAKGQDLTAIDPDAVAALPWQQVSEQMGRTRTARQCRAKWRAIQTAYHFDPASGTLVGPPEPDPDDLLPSQKKAEKIQAAGDGAIHVTRSVPRLPLLDLGRDGENGQTVPGSSGRAINDRTRRQVRAMGPADKYTLLQAIRASNVGREDKIPWTRIPNDDPAFRRRWTRAARELIWQRLKRAVPDHARKPVRDICDELIHDYEEERALAEAWDLDGEVEGDESNDDASDNCVDAKDTASKPLSGRRAPLRNDVYKSSEFAVDSDSESNAEISATADIPKQRPRHALSSQDLKKHVSESELDEGGHGGAAMDDIDDVDDVDEIDEIDDRDAEDGKGVNRHERAPSIDLGETTHTATTTATTVATTPHRGVAVAGDRLTKRFRFRTTRDTASLAGTKRHSVAAAEDIDDASEDGQADGVVARPAKKLRRLHVAKGRWVS